MQALNITRRKEDLSRILPSLVPVFAFILFPHICIYLVLCAKHGHRNILTCQRFLSHVRVVREVWLAHGCREDTPAGRSVLFAKRRSLCRVG
jgi:hypothetical protein